MPARPSRWEIECRKSATISAEGQPRTPFLEQSVTANVMSALGF
jgi:hypothetical protein